MLDLTAEEVARGVVVARRPVVDRNARSHGFELVYDANVPTNRWHPRTDSGVVAVHWLLHSHETSLEDVVGQEPAWCYVDHATFEGEAPLMLPPRQTVLQVTDAVPGPGLVEACRRRRREGYTIALDRLVDDELLEVVDVVAVDVSAETPAHAVDAVRRCQARGVRTLAKGCHTDAELAWAREVGFDLFIGRAAGVSRPPPQGELAPLVVSQVRLGVELLNDELDVDAVEDVLRHDPALTAQVLSLAAGGRPGGLRREVRSVREALVALGTRRLQRWAALAVIGRHGATDREALFTALLRARTCELLAIERGLDADFAFTAGLLSALDLLLGAPLDRVESQLNLSEELAAAAFRGETPVGHLVTEARDYQRVLESGAGAGPGDGALATAAAPAFAWAAALVQALPD